MAKWDGLAEGVAGPARGSAVEEPDGDGAAEAKGSETCDPAGDGTRDPTGDGTRDPTGDGPRDPPPTSTGEDPADGAGRTHFMLLARKQPLHCPGLGPGSHLEWRWRQPRHYAGQQQQQG